MPIIVRSAPSRRRIEMVAQRLLTWGALRPISSMNAKSTASRRGDWWVASPPHPPAVAAARKDGDHHQRRGRRALVLGPPSTFPPLTGTRDSDGKGIFRPHSGRPERRKMDRLAHGFS
ncbi:unnamed protein product [Gulo gulo]|uniref:Uncharacterized protein n=1 Tax=Gulo gulo TaxID=48420 RepID=A0A9X9LC86_GULGU|nr:unnamed protein product [Gulo gulo]